MSESDAETLRRALEDGYEVRIQIDDVGEVEGKPFQKTLERRAKHFDGVRPPHGNLTIDVSVDPDEMPSEEDTKPSMVSVWFGEDARGGWKEGVATWLIRDEISADAEETADVLGVEVVNDE